MSRLRYGIDPELEAEADRLINEQLRQEPSINAKRDVLTAWKQRDRWSREVYSTRGFPDPSVRQGLYHRAINSVQTHLNSRDGIAASARPGLRRTIHNDWDGSTSGLGA
jgi:hypothetical protein